MYFNVPNGVRQGQALSPKRFAIYNDDLSQDLVMCKSDCYTNKQCILIMLCMRTTSTFWHQVSLACQGSWMPVLTLA